MIVAKTVVPDRYWILREHDRKIGNIEADDRGFRLRIGDRVRTFETINTIQSQVPVEFDQPRLRHDPAGTDHTAHGYPTDGLAHNVVYDVRHQVPLWTREPRSRSWLAAGWYLLRQGRAWTVEFCPKLIMLERYEYQGPFPSESQARDRL